VSIYRYLWLIFEEKPMGIVTIEEAQAKLPDLIHKLTPGEEVVITENNQPGGISSGKATSRAVARGC
jgi:hypothetical protein